MLTLNEIKAKDGSYRLMHGNVKSIGLWVSKGGKVYLNGLEIEEDDFVKTLKFVEENS
jgi:hypothetical protein